MKFSLYLNRRVSVIFYMYFKLTIPESAMKQDGVAITKAGRLKTGFIIHVDTKYKTKEWLLPVEQCLKMAEDHTLKSVAFPTLGISKQVYVF